VIEIRSIAREPGYRTKVAVSSTDQRVDCVGACVGVRGNRIKNIVDEISGERIDIVRWSDDMQVLIPNALQPAEVEEVILCQMLGRAIVLVREDQLSLAIGRRGQNVRLASKLCGWDIEIMTREELDEQIEQAVVGFSSLEGVESELAEKLVGEGFLSYDDLSIIEPDALVEMGGFSAEQADRIVAQAEVKAAEAEKAAAVQRRLQREKDRQEPGEEAEAGEETKAEAKTEAEAEVEAEAGHDGQPAADAIEGQEAIEQDIEQVIEQDTEQDIGQPEEPATEELASEEPAGSAADDPPATAGNGEEGPSGKEEVDLGDGGDREEGR
jgi:N utilization substance protein A